MILTENLNATNITDTLLMRELVQNGIHDAKEVFYAGLAANGALYTSGASHKREEAQGQHGIE